MQGRLAVLPWVQHSGKRLGDVLRRAGYDVSFHATTDELMSAMARGGIDMVIATAERAERDLLRIADAVADTGAPLLVVSPTQSESFVIEVLRMGADGCLCEPFGDAEFLARVEAHMRRHWEWGAAGEPRPIEELQVDALSCSVVIHGREVRLTPTEYRLISRLAENAGEVVTNEDLRDHIWGLEGDANPSSLRLYVSHLRRKVEPDPRKPRYIRTKWGVGYYLQQGPSES